MTDIKCSCCGTTHGNLIFKGLTSIYSAREWSVVECENCRNIITIPVPSQQELTDIYGKIYMYPVHLLVAGEKKFRADAMAKFIRTNFPSDKKQKILEVGCMFGYLLSDLKKDYEVKGIEIGDQAVDFCRNEGLDVTDISIEDYLKESTESFNIIILSHVFEHLLKPGEVLDELRKRLLPGGKIIICVPNSNSISRKLFGRYWGWWQVPVHINHFRKEALIKIASNKKLAVEKVIYKGGDSLMIVLNFINMFGFRSDNLSPGAFQKIILMLFSSVFRYWYYIGNEEITVVMRQKDE